MILTPTLSNRIAMNHATGIQSISCPATQAGQQPLLAASSQPHNDRAKDKMVQNHHSVFTSVVDRNQIISLFFFLRRQWQVDGGGLAVSELFPSSLSISCNN